jgi:hypothetical protein
VVKKKWSLFLCSIFFSSIHQLDVTYFNWH